MDLAVANIGNSTAIPNVSILLGNGDGTFQAAVPYATSYFPSFIAVADFNGDGRLDLAVTSTDDSTAISVLLGNGEGTFQPQVQYTVGTNPSSIAVGDFNGDGKLDMVVANTTSQNLSVLFGNGDGTFKPQVTIAAGQALTSVVTGDFNEDGQPDLAIADDLLGVWILLGNANGSFQQPINLAIQEPATIAVADLNNDGHLDLAARVQFLAPTMQDISCITKVSARGLLETSVSGHYLECGGRKINSGRTNKSGCPLPGRDPPIWSGTRAPGKSLRS